MRLIDADVLKQHIDKLPALPDGNFAGNHSALKALINMQPTIEPSTNCSEFPNNSDTVSRQAAIDALDCINGVEEVLRSLPSVQPERKKGEWLPDNNNAYEMRFICSCCKESEVVPTIGFTKYKPLWDFCPNCGADMRGEKDG